MKTLVILGFIVPYKIVLPTLLIIIITITIIYYSRKKKKGMGYLSDQMINKGTNLNGEMSGKEEELDSLGDNEFYVKAIDKNELSECSIGDKVSLWKNPEEDYILVFRQGFVAGEGRLGQVAYVSYQKIATHLLRGDTIKAKISSISFNKCKIKYQVITKEEIFENRKNNLQKPYKPKSNFDLLLCSPGLVGTGLRKGDKLKLIFKTKEYYLEHPDDLIVDIADTQGHILGSITTTEALKPVKAYFNDFKFDVTISKKKEDTVYLKVIPYKD